MKLSATIILSLAAAVCGLARCAGNDGASALALVIERQRAVLKDALAIPVNMRAGDAPLWIGSLRGDGRWGDIDYENCAGGAWPALAHLHRVRILVRSLALADADDPRLRDTIMRALAHWIEKRYQNPNWWQNEIGVPQVMRDIIVLLGDRLAGDLREGAISVLRQYKQQPSGYGANTVWTAELALMDGALGADPKKIAVAARIISDEITVGAAQGIQRDFSFYQHGNRLQQFHYGRSFFQDTARLAWILRGTLWAFSGEKTAILGDYALEGCAWMCRGIATVPGTLDRAASRPGTLGSTGDLRRELSLLSDLLPERRAAFDRLRAAQDAGAPAVMGFRSFPYSDFSAYQKTEYSFFLKTISTRTEVTETLSRENQKGKYLNWGDHYIVRDGREYADLMPAWDWDLLPGVTAHAGVATIDRQPFCGAAGDGESGVTAMNYRVRGESADATLTARKLWTAHDGVVVALIGALSARNFPSAQPVRTALDQCRLRGDVTTNLGGAAVGFTAREGVRWIHHAGMLYVPLGSVDVSLRAGDATGSWKRINLNYSDDPVTEQVFLPVLEHGSAPANQSSGFAIMACAAPDEAAGLVAKPIWQVLRNDTSCQAVRFHDGVVMAAFYEPGKIEAGGTPLISADQPCIVLLKGDWLFTSDPTHKGRTLNVTVGARCYRVTCPPNGGAEKSALLNP